MTADGIAGMLLGLAAGDALGVPVEFRPRFELEEKPVTGMRGFGTWNQPPGTWSDDSSLSLCLAESLVSGIDLRAIADSFIGWKDGGVWSARGTVFDIGHVTAAAIERLKDRTRPPEEAGLRRTQDNGNGGLMRIMPLAIAIAGFPLQDRIETVCRVTALTHGHIRSLLASVYWTEFTLEVAGGGSLAEAQIRASGAFSALLRAESEAGRIGEKQTAEELGEFSRILSGTVPDLPATAIRSSTYVIHTLEAALWCFTTTSSFTDAVLRAVNLGEDTDTIGCIVGGLAGLAYGPGSIPPEWLSALARREDIEALARRLAARYP